jgi:hypothetical protein
MPGGSNDAKCCDVDSGEHLLLAGVISPRRHPERSRFSGGAKNLERIATAS